METTREEPKKPNAMTIIMASSKKFFKVIGRIALIIIGLIVVLSAYFGLDYYLAEKEQAKVKIEVSYDTEKCKNQPLYITITNNAKKTIKKTRFHLEITRKGYSNNLSDYTIDYETDAIIEPNYVFSKCWDYKLKPEYAGYDIPRRKLEELTPYEKKLQEVNSDNLEFKINYQDVTFEE